MDHRAGWLWRWLPLVPAGVARDHERRHVKATHEVERLQAELEQVQAACERLRGANREVSEEINLCRAAAHRSRRGEAGRR